jgi:hypothetical protein
MIVRELGRVSLVESLALTSSAMQNAPERGRRYAVRWLRRLLEEGDLLTLEDVALAVSSLQSLGGRSRHAAASTLTAMAERATRQSEQRRLAS